MHEKILIKRQTQLLPLVKSFSSQFGLAGGTAIALQIGHRRSIDFDLFSSKRFFNSRIQNQIRDKFKIQKIFIDKPNELTLLANNVRITFYKYPFDIQYKIPLNDIIKMPDLLTLTAMKSLALSFLMASLTKNF